MRFSTPVNEFLSFTMSSPNPASNGVTITPGASNAKGSWFDLLGGTITEDVYGIEVIFIGGVSSIDLSTLTDIGVDPAGGTAYVTKIPNLLHGSAFSGSAKGRAPFRWFFPLFIASGGRIAARSQQSVATPNNHGAHIVLWHKPTRPELWYCGKYVDAVGITLATSKGTTVAYTGGDARSKSPWASLGTLPREGKFIAPVITLTAAVLSNIKFHSDFASGDGTNKRILVPDIYSEVNSSEEGMYEMPPSGRCYHNLPAGTELFARTEANIASPETPFTAAAYIVGG